MTLFISNIRKALLLFPLLISSVAVANESPEKEASKTGADEKNEFIELFDGTLDGWVIENTEADNFTVSDGILRVEEPEGWLRSEEQYSDFMLRIEFRFLTEDADSGIFIRSPGEEAFSRGWPNRSYQIQMRNPLGESRFPPIGGIFRHGRPDGETIFDPEDAARLSTGTDEWQLLEIEVIGEELKVWLNEELLTEAKNILNETGYIGIQGETGAFEFRSIKIAER
ncbi:MAG: DUF1080 domain-containing protein [Opitutales bacterium]